MYICEMQGKNEKKTKREENTENPTRRQKTRKGKEKSKTKREIFKVQGFKGKIKSGSTKVKPGQHYAKPKPEPESCTKSKPRHPSLNLKP